MYFHAKEKTKTVLVCFQVGRYPDIKKCAWFELAVSVFACNAHQWRDLGGPWCNHNCE